MTLLRRLLIYLLLLTAGVLQCQAQTPTCTLTIGRLPEVRGFRLGMTAQEVERRHPDLSLAEPDVVGYAVTDVSAAYVKSSLRPPAGEGLDSVRLVFLDGTLVKLRITYDGLTEWNSADEFLAAMISNLKLPSKASWAVIDSETRQLDCIEVAVQVHIEPKQSKYELQRPSIAFVQDGVDKILADRARSRTERQQERLGSKAPSSPGSNVLTVEAYIEPNNGAALPAAGASLFLLNADPLKLFDEEDVRLTRFLSEGEDEGEALVAEFLSASRAVNGGGTRGGSAYLKKFYDDAMPALKPHIIQSVVADADGNARFSPVATGTYYLIGAAKPPIYAVWNLKVALTQPETIIRLNRKNTMSALRTQATDEQIEQRRKQEADQRRRVFRP